MKTNSITPDSCLQRLEALCARGEHCEHDLREKMRRWQLSDDDADAVIAKLRRNDFINDGRFARAYALDKLRYNQWGRTKLRYMLHALGLPEDAIRQALDEIDEDEHEAVRRALIEKKNREIKDRDPYIRKAKLQRFLYSRGFSPDI